MKAIVIGAAALLLYAVPIQAQVQEPAAPPQQQPSIPPAPQQTASVSQGDIEVFARIYVAVSEQRSKLSQKMEEAESQEAAQAVQAEMQEVIVTTIAEHGWSVERYNAVADAISTDPELRSSAVSLINELTSS